VNPEGIKLFYEIESDTDSGQRGAELDNDLFAVLAAVQEHGSISHASEVLLRSYRYTWGQLKHWEGVLGHPLIEWMQGKKASLTPYAKRLLWAERQARVRMTPHLEALRAQLLHVFAVAADPKLEVIDVCASHDLALPRLQAMAAPEKLHLNLQFAGSQEALRALQDGRCTVAGFHVPRLREGSDVFASALRDLLHPGEHKLIGSHRRRQGLMFRRPLSRQVMLRGLRDLVEGSWRLVNRQPGSGTRMLMDHLVHEMDLSPQAIDGYFTRIETTHVAVAAAVASGAGDVGLGIEAAAHEFGLDFLPIAEEDYFLVCLKPALESPAVRRLRALLALPAWREELVELPGYSAHRPGQVLSLTRALPWWHFAVAKQLSETRP
jgi:molybdate transport repressor ModE-like protein